MPARGTAGFGRFSPNPNRAIVPRMSFWGWLLLGAGSWILAVVLKILADFIVQRTTTVALQDWFAAVLSGVWSSVCELGLAALAYWIWQASFSDALVMAVGAALAEFLILLLAAISANWKTPQTKAKEAAGWSAFFIERAVAVASHLASRALTWLGVGGSVGPAALGSALGLFAVTEGVQAYAQAKEWDWLNRRTLWTFLSFQIAIVLVEIGLVVHWWQT